MKKAVAALLLVCLILFAATACGKKDTPQTQSFTARDAVTGKAAYIPNEAIVADEYIDYAAEVNIDYDKYPWLLDMEQGLYWT
ncbi:MAG TPA: hypothetical protein PK245_07360, partial [Clostridia bacterium]|nr:hypothetical protein [Clostridia bacterium]